MVDPKLVRLQGDASPLSVTKDLLYAAVPRLSRQQLTSIVDLLALKDFHTLQKTPQGRQNYKVVPQMLGVYRPFEHIDNPTTLDREAVNPKRIDPDFQALVFADDPLNATMYKSSMKRYIQRPIAFMKKKLQSACEAGPTPEGMRFFGEALHILEDYFAHSNFVELSLRKQGHEEVLVWVPEVASAAESKHKWPVITGMFSTLDVLNSVIDPLANILFPTHDEHEALEPGERTDQEQAILILLDDGEGSIALEMYKAYLQAMDRIKNNWLYKWVKEAKRPLDSLHHALNKVKKPLLKLSGDQIANLQVHLENDPNTDPTAMATHSQLSKDHDTHPFHTLAVLLARHAVTLVGRAMHARWQGKEDAPDPFKVARKLIRHPNDSDWQDIIVGQWATENPDKVEQGKSLETLRTLQAAELSELSADIDKALKEMEAYFTELEQLTDVSLWQMADAPPSPFVPF
ncbi:MULTISPECIES: HET-C-related protein [unclassified Pseudomonas]|uniref:HET-C-related protein n=1 Tax=unclassified Pseudomonas TaxID=196821 RepID=UPI0035BF034C